MAGGNTFQSGQIAMDVVHLWYTCCVYPAEGDPSRSPTGTSPSCRPGPDGKVTSKLHADTIGILDSSKHPDEAFEVLSFLAVLARADPDLGCDAGHREPAGRLLRRSRHRRFAPLKVDWQVARDMLEYPDVPSHEAFMPNFPKADAANKALGSKLWTTRRTRSRCGDRHARRPSCRASSTERRPSRLPAAPGTAVPQPFPAAIPQ